MSNPSDPTGYDPNDPTRRMPAQEPRVERETGAPPEPPPPRIIVDAVRLWSGGLATAVVAGLIAWIGVLIANTILELDIARAAVVLSLFESFTANYVITAVILALAATGLGHLLSLSTPRPRSFFSWIVGLVTVVGIVLPFTRGGEIEDKLAVGVINLVLGIAIGSLLSAVMARTITIQTTRIV